MLDILLEEPRNTPWNKWACGIGVPALLTLWGARVMLVQHISFRGRAYHTLTGSDAWWFGLAIIGAAGMVHCHFFWNNHTKLASYANLGKVASLVTAVLGMGIVVFNMCRPF